MTQATWGDFSWGISANEISGIATFSRIRSLKRNQQNDLYGSASATNRGLEPFSVTFSWNVSNATGTSIWQEIKRWESAIGESNVLGVGGETFYENPLQLTSFSASDVAIDCNGNCLTAKFTAIFSENIPEETKLRQSKQKQRKDYSQFGSKAQRSSLGISSGTEVAPSKSAKATYRKDVAK